MYYPKGNINSRMNRRLYMALMIAILPNIIIGFLYFKTTINQLEDRFKADLTLEADNAAKDVSRHMDYLHKNLTNLRIFAVALEFQRFEGLQKFFNSVVKSDPNYTGMLFLNDEEKLVAHNTVSFSGDPINDADAYWDGIAETLSYIDLPKTLGLIRVDEYNAHIVLRAPISDQDGKLKGYLVAIYKNEFINETFRKGIRRFPPRFAAL